MSRSVIVNLRIKSPHAVKLGIDAHICEIQLVLRRFAELKVLPLANPSRREYN
jgi:hypothetical protein